MRSIKACDENPPKITVCGAPIRAHASSAIASSGVSQPLYPEVILGSLISVLPLLILFPFLQKYVARGLTFGAIAGE